MLLTILSASTSAATDSTLSVTWSAIALVALAIFFGVGYYLMELRGKKETSDTTTETLRIIPLREH
jgi:hypothetical protein